MARLGKEKLIARALGAIEAGGWTVARLSANNVHPARFTMSRDGVVETVRLYIWNLSHGGKSRSESEFRIQITGIEQFEPEAGGRSLILGWSEDFEMFAGFDITHRLGAMGASPSIQITSTTLEAGKGAGGALQDKTKGEWAAAVRPDRLDRYVQHLAEVHAGKPDPLVADESDPAADPLASQIKQLSDDSKGFDLAAVDEAKLRQEILDRVDEMLAALGSAHKDAPAQMGHNQPPESLDDPPGLAPDIEAAAIDVKTELETDAPDPRRVGEAGGFLAWAGKLVTAAKVEGSKIYEKGKDLAREYIAKALLGTGASIIYSYKVEIGEMIRAIASSILNWLQHIAIF